MREGNDKISLIIVLFAVLFFSAFLVLLVLGLLGCKCTETIKWLCLALSLFLCVIFIPIRGEVIYRKKRKKEIDSQNNQIIANKKATEIKGQFLQWIIEQYASVNIKKGPDIGNLMVHGANNKSYKVKAKETYMEMGPFEVKFEDLESVYPKNETDKELDQKIRERVFDLLEHPDRILRVKEKYRVYSFMDEKKHPELFGNYNLAHHIEM